MGLSGRTKTRELQTVPLLKPRVAPSLGAREMQVGSTARITSRLSGCSYQRERETTRRAECGGNSEQCREPPALWGVVSTLEDRNEVLITEAPPNPAIPLLGMRPKEMERGSQRDVSVPMCTETRVTGAKKLRCLPMHGWGESCCLRPALQRKTREVLPCAAQARLQGATPGKSTRPRTTVLREAPPWRL